VARQTKRTTSGIPRPPDHHHSTGRPDAKFRRGGRAGKGTGSRHQTKNEPAGDRNECRGLTALSGPKRPTDLAANAQMITDDVASRETGAPRRRATRNQNGTDATTIRTELQARGYVPGTDGVGIWILEDPEDEEDTGKKESQRRGMAKEKPAKARVKLQRLSRAGVACGGTGTGGGPRGKGPGTVGTRRNAARITTEATA
jgi:hypothetical protein